MTSRVSTLYRRKANLLYFGLSSESYSIVASYSFTDDINERLCSARRAYLPIQPAVKTNYPPVKNVMRLQIYKIICIFANFMAKISQIVCIIEIFLLFLQRKSFKTATYDSSYPLPPYLGSSADYGLR